MQESFSLEYGLIIGGVLFSAGSIGAIYSIYSWFASGFQQLPAISTTIISYTFIFLGLSIIFSSFFVEILEESE
jgi:hypothetical protein